MPAKQLTVFIENRPGRLCDVLEVLKKGGISILSMSLADTTEYGLLRLIVNRPADCKDLLSDAGFSTLLSEVLVIKLSHHSGSLLRLTQLLHEQGISIDYMYGLSVEGDEASLVVKTSELERAEEILRAGGTEFLTAEEMARM